MVDITQGDYRIYIGADNIYIQQLQYNRILIIEKFSSNIYESDQDILNKVVIYNAIKPHAVLGIIKIGSIDFLVYVKICQVVGTIEKAEIFKIKEIDLIPITDDITANNLSSDIKSYINGIKNLLQLGYFYSFHYDLTTTKQKQAKNSRSVTAIFDQAERKFFWNFNLYKKFINKSVNKIWMVVCICGYVGISIQPLGEYSSNSNKVAFILISRRSIYYAGTRYNARGIDDDGHVANYLETEQIIIVNKNILSFVQVRGSVPVFWQQTGLSAQTQITRSPEMTSPAFLKHIEEIQHDFQMIFIINLMNSGKPNEQIITQNLENQIKTNNLKSCRYYFFDFQNECKFDNYDKLDLFMNNLENVYNIFKFYCEDTNSGEIHKEQSGVFRTNCLDCLDRTNVIQTRIGWKVLEIMLNFLNIDTGFMFDPSNGTFFAPKRSYPLMEAFKDLWADNGDHISIQYAGTASTITTVTKTGKHGFLGLIQHGLVSVTRLYQGSFEDNFKQKCIDIWLQKAYVNNNLNGNIGVDPILEEELKKHESKFTQSEELLFYIGSWNVGGREPNSMIFEWMFPMKDLKTPDVYIIGLQEMVDLNAKNIMISSNSNKVDFWKNLINKHLNEIDKYVCLKILDLVGILFVVYIKESLKENVRNIDNVIIRTGLLGTMGNKGSCLIRFNYLDSSFAISCGHLSAGSANVNARIMEINEVLNKTFSYKNLKFKDHDVQFIFGDLNFRIDTDMHTCRQMIASGSLHSLAAYDQLNKAKSVSSTLIELDEGELTFDPTYKYTIGTSEYDLKKKRVPSWCDRILFKKNSGVKLVDYNRLDYTISDHKPIYGLFKVNALKVDQDLKTQIIKELRETISIGVNSVNASEFFKSDINEHINDDFFNSMKRFGVNDRIPQENNLAFDHKLNGDSKGYSSPKNK